MHTRSVFMVGPTSAESLGAFASGFVERQSLSARYDGHPDKQTDTVGFCLKLIDKCDVVVFSRLLGKDYC